MDRDKRDAIVKVAEGGAAVAAAAAGSPELAAAAMFLAALPETVGVVLPAVMNQQGRRTRTWWQSVARGDDGGDDAFEAELNRRVIDDEKTQAVIMESLRKLLESLEAATIFPLARLTRRYLKEHRRPDIFFRGVAEVLSRLNAEELASLRGILEIAIEVGARTDDDDYVKLLHRWPDDPDQTKRKRVKGSEPWAVGYYDFKRDPTQRFVGVREIPHAREVFALLKAARLADDFRGAYGETAGPDDLLIARETAERFLELLSE